MILFHKWNGTAGISCLGKISSELRIDLRMKTLRFPLLLVILLAVVLSGCTGAVVNSWPGVTAQQDTIYLSHQGSIYAINAANGQLSCKFPESPDPSKPFYAAPAVGEDTIVAGNYGHLLYGLGTTCENEKRVFSQKWVFDTGSQDPDKRIGNFSGSPIIVDDTVLAPSTNNRLYALSLADGSLKWFYETANTLWAAPVSDGTVVYLPGLDHNLYALNVSDGSLLWKKDLGSALTSAPLMDGELLYSSTLEGKLVALNAQDGSIAWESETGGRMWSTPLLHEDVLYVGNANEKVLAIDKADGSIVWQKEAGSPVIGGGVIINEAVAFPTEDGMLVGWSLDGNQQTLNQTIGGKLYTTPVIAGDKAVVALMDGEKLLQALTLDGGLNWTFVQPK
jgi:outer membrane protein assembly factor BamB